MNLQFSGIRLAFAESSLQHIIFFCKSDSVLTFQAQPKLLLQLFVHSTHCPSSFLPIMLEFTFYNHLRIVKAGRDLK